MSNQCRSCGRDLNNNYTPYASGYPNANHTNNDRQQMSYNTRSTTTTSTSLDGSAPSVTAKVMFGSVGAIKELREKEKSRNSTTRTGRRN